MFHDDTPLSRPTECQAAPDCGARTTRLRAAVRADSPRRASRGASPGVMIRHGEVPLARPDGRGRSDHDRGGCRNHHAWCALPPLHRPRESTASSPRDSRSSSLLLWISGKPHAGVGKRALRRLAVRLASVVLNPPGPGRQADSRWERTSPRSAPPSQRCHRCRPTRSCGSADPHVRRRRSCRTRSTRPGPRR